MIVIIIIFIIIVIFDMKTILLKTNKRLKTITIYFSFIIISFVVSLLLYADKNPISPAIIIEGALKSIKVIQ